MSPSHIRVGQLIQMLPMSKATIWRKVKDGSFPKPVKLSQRITAWHVDEVQAFVDKARGGSAK